MKTLQIENTREIFFNDSKEQFLHFKKVWSQAVNSEKAKKKVVERTYAISGTEHSYTELEKGWLTGTHHLIYTLMRGRDVYKSFTPTTSKNKLSNGAFINYGLYNARYNLGYMAGRAKQFITNVEKTNEGKSWFGRKRVIFSDHSQLEKFLLPFEGTVTPLMLIKLDELCPEIKPLESSYGKGKQLAQKIIAGEIKPITYEDMQEMYA